MTGVIRFRRILWSECRNWLRNLTVLVPILMLSVGVALAQYAGPAVSAPPPSAGAPAGAMRLPLNNVKIMPGDVVAIATYGAAELTVPTLKIGAQGEVVLPYLGTVKLAGMTPSEAADYLAKQLKEQGILVDPQVSIDLVDSPTRMVTVLGEVTRPAPVPAFGQLRLLDAVAACGGFTPLASHRITVRRPGDSEPITVQLGTDPRSSEEANIPLMPGDTVIVPKVGSVYVVGQVRTPAAIPLSSNAPITVMRAISISGGLKYGAAMSKAMIVRTNSDNQRIEIVMDLKKIQSGKQRDVALASDDVLFIPTNGFKAGLAAGAAQTAIYAAVSLGYIVQ